MRLRNQRLVVGGARGSSWKFKTAPEVVGWLGAVQSQEYALARWSVGMRTRGLSEAEVETAVARGRILRTHILRPTWHFVLPRDIRWVQRLTAPRVDVGNARREALLGLDKPQMSKALRLIEKALRDGSHLTRQDLGENIERGGVSVDGQRLSAIVMRAEMELLVASGKPRGWQQTYALLDEWAPPTKADSAPFERDEALAKLALRYFTGHGPATVSDFTWWSSLTVGDARRGIAANGKALEKLDVDGTDYYWAGDATSGADDPKPTAHLLQGYDEYIVAYRAPRSPLNVSGLASNAVMSRPPFLHALVMDGQATGFWRRVPAKEGFAVETSLLRDLSAREASALGKAVSRYSAFLGQPVALK